MQKVKLKPNFILSIIIGFLIIFGAILALLYFNYKTTQKENLIKKYFDFNLRLIADEIENTSLNATMMATLLSRNQDIKECFSSLNHDFCFKTLSHYQDIISQIPTYQNSLIHAHSKNQISLARSWSDNYDDNLSAFRHSLLKIKKLT